MEKKVFKFRVAEVCIAGNKSSNPFLKLVCEYEGGKGMFAGFEQNSTRTITYYYPVVKLPDGMKAGVPEREISDDILHIRVDGEWVADPSKFVTKFKTFHGDDGKEITVKWLYSKAV